MDSTFSIGWTGNADPVSSRPTITHDTGIVQEFTLAGSTTNQEMQIGFDVANLKGVIVTVTDNNGAVTLKTNSTGSPDLTWVFASGGAEAYWTSRSPMSNPFGSTDVTTTYWTNAGSATATVKVRIALNA